MPFLSLNPRSPIPDPAYMPRSNSLMPILPRVLASTFFTITAQYRLYLPSLEGRLPLTTTEPAGTRP